MKTPDEIKKGLEWHSAIDSKCKACPYTDPAGNHGECTLNLTADALAYIQQLESTVSQVSKALCGKGFATLEVLLQAASQVNTNGRTDNAVD